MSCGKIIGRAMGYNKICGGLWMGGFSICEKCKKSEKPKKEE